tara:strand:- start:994 stop:2256 length:1263 start_codon:yes stop_codon:yes gene_type:complete
MLTKTGANKSKVALRCNSFPVTSQTFVLNHVALLREKNWGVELHVDDFNFLKKALALEALKDTSVEESIYICLRADTSFFDRFVSVVKHCFKFNSFSILLKSMNPMLYGRSGLNLRVYRSFSSLLETHQPNLAHAHFGHNGVSLIQAKLCGAINCPVITSFHGYDAYLGGDGVRRFRKKYRLLFKYGDLFFANTKYLKNILMKLGCPENKIKVMPNFIDTDLFSPSSEFKLPTKAECNLITVGRLIPLKNQKLGILVTAHLKKMGINAIYTIVGGGPELRNLKNMAYENGVSESVRFLGEMSPLEIAEELKKQHIFLMTTREDDEGRAETQGIVTLEAQSAGLPAVVSGVGGTPETIEHGESGWVVHGALPEDIAMKVSELLNPQTYQEFSCAARKNSITRFSRKTVEEQILEAYREVME